MSMRLIIWCWAHRRRFAAGVGLLLLAGCAPAGDLGRFRADGKPLPDPVITGALPSAFPLTDDERALREQARGLFVGPDLPTKGPRVSAALPLGGPPIVEASPALYAEYLVLGPYRSATARYAKLIDDTRNDLTRLDPFFMLARRVADMDRKREQSLGAVSAVSRPEFIDARRRIRENMMLMTEVHRTLIDRAAMYRFALERLVIALPSPMAAEAERLRGELERRLGGIQIAAGSAVQLGPPIAASGRPPVTK